MTNNFDNDFLAELSQLECDSLPQPTEDDIMRIHSLCLKKAEIATVKKPNKNIRFMRILATAAVAVFAVLGMGATYLKASDFFKASMMAKTAVPENALMASDAQPRYDSTSQSYAMNEKTFSNTVEPMSAMIGQTVADQGVELTAQAAMGDNDTLMLILDAKSVTEDIVLRDNIQLENITLRVDDASTGTSFEQNLHHAELQEIDENGMARFIVKEKVQQGFLGKNATLTINGLSAMANSTGVSIPAATTLYDFFIKNDIANKDNLVPVYMTKKEEAQLKEYDNNILYDKSGAAIWGYNLAEATEAVQQTAKQSQIAVFTDMQLLDNVFYVNAYIPPQSEPIQNVALKNNQTGAIVNGGCGMSLEQDGSAFISLNAEGIASAEDLKNYSLVLNAGYISVPVVQGTWKFDIPLQFTDLSNVFELNQEIVVDDITLHIASVAVSPISVTVRGKVIDGAFLDSISFGQVKLIMQDGKTVTLREMTSSLDHSTQAFDIQLVLPCVIEPTKLKSVVVGNVVIDI